MNIAATAAISIIWLAAAAATGEAGIAADPGWSHAKLVGETIKEWLLAAAILGGGIWAYWKYVHSESLSAQRKARLSEAPPHVNISILPELYELKDGNFNLVVDVILEHAGTGQILVDLDTVPPLSIIQLQQSETGEYDVPGEPRQPRIMSSVNIHDATIYPGGKLCLKFIEKVANESIYLIEFHSQVAETFVTDQKTAGTGETGAAGESNRASVENRRNFISRLATDIIHVGFPRIDQKDDEDASDNEPAKKD